MAKSHVRKRIVRHEQWIEIKAQDGVVVVTRYPSNEEFERLRLKMEVPPDLIYRRLNFIGGVPDEYRGTDPTPEVAQYGGLFVQRMSVSSWLDVLSRERESGSDRVLPTHDAVGRPEEFGPCPCPRCTEECDLDAPSRYSHNFNNP